MTVQEGERKHGSEPYKKRCFAEIYNSINNKGNILEVSNDI